MVVASYVVVWNFWSEEVKKNDWSEIFKPKRNSLHPNSYEPFQ